VKGKISKDYHARHKESYGIIYAIATILCPSKKLRYFDSKDWQGEDEDRNCANFMKTYQYALQKEFNQYHRDYCLKQRQQISRYWQEKKIREETKSEQLRALLYWEGRRAIPETAKLTGTGNSQVVVLYYKLFMSIVVTANQRLCLLLLQ
jgi:hypothetical protein